MSKGYTIWAKRFFKKLWASKFWLLYAGFVHNTLFFEFIRHELPQEVVLALASMMKMLEEHVLIILAILFTWMASREKGRENVNADRDEPNRRDSDPPRDKNGRFIRISKRPAK